MGNNTIGFKIRPIIHLPGVERPLDLAHPVVCLSPGEEPYLGVCQRADREPVLRLPDQGEHDPADQELRFQVSPVGEVHPGCEDSASASSLLSMFSSSRWSLTFMPLPLLYLQATNCGIVESILNWVKFKAQTQLNKKCSSVKHSKIKGIPKLDDANDAGELSSALHSPPSPDWTVVNGLHCFFKDTIKAFTLTLPTVQVRSGQLDSVVQDPQNQLVQPTTSHGSLGPETRASRSDENLFETEDPNTARTSTDSKWSRRVQGLDGFMSLRGPTLVRMHPYPH